MSAGIGKIVEFPGADARAKKEIEDFLRKNTCAPADVIEPLVAELFDRLMSVGCESFAAPDTLDANELFEQFAAFHERFKTRAFHQIMELTIKLFMCKYDT